jgi:hypothetical protein
MTTKLLESSKYNNKYIIKTHRILYSPLKIVKKNEIISHFH